MGKLLQGILDNPQQARTCSCAAATTECAGPVMGCDSLDYRDDKPIEHGRNDHAQEAIENHDYAFDKKSSLLSNKSEHLLYEQNSTVKSYSGAEQLDVTMQEGHTIARFLWKQYAVSIGITGLEKRSNMGEAQMINLLSAKATQAEMSLRDRMSVDAFADGTGNGGKNLTGLTALVSTTATVGGLAPATHTWWVADVGTSTGSFASGGIAAMRSKFNDITFGNDKPDVIFTTQAIHEYYEQSLQPQERFSSNTIADAGFMNITFKNVPVIFDRDCTSGVMYFLNSKYLNLCCHRDADISTGPFITPENQDVSTAMVLFQGNLTTNNRRKLGSLTGITA